MLCGDSIQYSNNFPPNPKIRVYFNFSFNLVFKLIRSVSSIGLYRPFRIEIHGHRFTMEPSSLQSTSPIQQQDDDEWGMQFSLQFHFFIFFLNQNRLIIEGKKGIFCGFLRVSLNNWDINFELVTD